MTIVYGKYPHPAQCSCTMCRYQAMVGNMDSLVRVLDELKQTVGQALGPNVALQMTRATEAVKDIAYT